MRRLTLMVVLLCCCSLLSASPGKGNNAAPPQCTAPAITTQPAAQLACPGTTASFSITATGTDLSYQWRRNNQPIPGATAATFTIPSVSTADAAHYDVVITGACGSATSNTAALTLQQTTLITSQPQARAVCAGTNTSLEVIAIGAGISYQWRKNGTPIGGQTGATLNLNAVSAADAGVYDVVITNTCNAATTSNAAQLTVNEPVVITAAPAGRQVCIGSAVTLSVSATGSNLSYQWYRQNIPLPGATGSSFTIPSFSISNEAMYAVTVQGACNTVQSGGAQLSQGTTTVITTQPQNASVCAGGSASFTVGAAGTDLGYQWYKNNLPIAGATTATLILNNVGNADIGAYKVDVSGCTMATSNSANLSLSTGNTWRGTVSSDWNHAANWCTGVPGAASDITISSGTPFAPAISATASVRDLTITSGATLTIANGGLLQLHRNLANNGTVNAAEGSIAFLGSSVKTISGALTVKDAVVDGSGGLTLGGALTVTGNLTLTNGHITLGEHNLILNRSSNGSVASHVITNGTGAAVSNNIGSAPVIIPIGPDDGSYNPVTITNGNNRAFTVRVATGLNPAIANGARGINRTWNIVPSTGSSNPADVGLQFTEAQGNGSVVVSSAMEGAVHNGSAWLVMTPTGGVLPAGSGSDKTLTFSTTLFGPTAVASPGGFSNVTSINNSNPDFEWLQLLPNPVQHTALLKIGSRRTLAVQWFIVDGEGKLLRSWSHSLQAGGNVLPIQLGNLPAGVYYLHGYSGKGGSVVLRFMKE